MYCCFNRQAVNRHTYPKVIRQAMRTGVQDGMHTESEGRFGNLDPNKGGYNGTIASSIDLFAGTSRSQVEIVGGIAKDGPWGRPGGGCQI